MNRILAIALLCGISSPVFADTANERLVRGVTDKTSFERVFYETIKKVAASNPTTEIGDPAVVDTACYPANDAAQMLAYCQTDYELYDGPDKLIAGIQTYSSGQVEKSLTVYNHNTGSLYLYENGSLGFYNRITKTSQHLRDHYPAHEG
jgi:hypothetical protein